MLKGNSLMDKESTRHFTLTFILTAEHNFSFHKHVSLQPQILTAVTSFYYFFSLVKSKKCLLILQVDINQ